MYNMQKPLIVDQSIIDRDYIPETSAWNSLFVYQMQSGATTIDCRHEKSREPREPGSRHFSEK